MLIFCEDCGAQQNIEFDQENPEEVKFRCDACGFLISVSPPPPPSSPSGQEPKGDKSPPDLQLLPSHACIDFGVVAANKEKRQTLLVAAADGRRIDLHCTVSRSLCENVKVTRLSHISFMVTLVTPALKAFDLLPEFDDIGLQLEDVISGAKVQVAIAFRRDVP
ncbi:MAG: hypothetical protein ABFR97_01105 [Thermodesulfobacteriota bacterium]